MSTVIDQMVTLRRAGGLIRRARKVFVSVDYGRVSLKLSKVQARSLVTDLRARKTTELKVMSFLDTICLAL